MSAPTITDIPIWLINLPSSAQRFDAMHKQLTTVGLDYRHFQAINGKERWSDLQGSIDIPTFERNVGRPVMAGEIGCYHSHLGVWRAFLETDAPAALVLEDDVIFHDTFSDAVNAALTVLDQWDIVKLNYIRAKWPKLRLQVQDWQCLEYVGSFTGTGAYLINRQVVQKLLDGFLPIVRPIDHEIDRSHRHKIRHYGLSPYPSHLEDDGQSTITGSNFSGIAKFPIHQRLPVYANRFQNLVGKIRYSYRQVSS